MTEKKRKEISESAPFDGGREDCVTLRKREKKRESPKRYLMGNILKRKKRKNYSLVQRSLLHFLSILQFREKGTHLPRKERL